MWGAVHVAGPKLAADAALETALRIAAVGAAAVRPMRIRARCKTDSQVTGVVIQERESRFSEVKCTCRIWVHQNAPYLDCQRPPTRTAFADIWTTSAATAC